MAWQVSPAARPSHDAPYVHAASPALAVVLGGLRRPGFDRLCRARPADRSLVAEDRSAAGVRDQTGPGLGPCWVRGAPGPQGHERSPTVTNDEENLQVDEPSAQAARTTAGSESDCGPEGRLGAWTPTLGADPSPVDACTYPSDPPGSRRGCGLLGPRPLNRHCDDMQVTARAGWYSARAVRSDVDGINRDVVRPRGRAASTPSLDRAPQTDC
jgi:hypothetical protein